MTTHKKDTPQSLQGLVFMPQEVFNEILENQKNILANQQKENNKPINTGDWLTEKETQELLSKKTTTLYYFRKKGWLVSTKVGNKTFYSRESILKLMEQNKRNGIGYP